MRAYYQPASEMNYQNLSRYLRGSFQERRLFGNVKGVSTSHYLVSLLHFLHQGANKVNNVGTVVLTDFSKAFDMVDHNLLIEKFIHIGVRRSIAPWLCDFLSNRMQCVRYNSTLSDFATLSAGLPQGH